MASGFTWAVLGVVTVILLVMFYAFIIGQPREEQITQIVNISLPEVNEAPRSIELSAAYWGEKNRMTSAASLCAKKDSESNFTIEAHSSLDAINYKECYIILNGEKTETEIFEIHDNFIAAQASALPNEENSVKLCCDFYKETDCTKTAPLIKC